MIVGVDPGKTGGIVWLTDTGDWVAGHRTPITKIGKRDVIDIDVLANWMHDYYVESDHWAEELYCVMEFVTSFGQGRTSAFNFGRYVGAVESFCLNWAPENLTMVTPQSWKKAWNLDKDKRASLQLASVKFPEAQIDWTVLANDGIAEAALIALYMLRKKCVQP